MLVRTRKTTEFFGTPTTREERKLLQEVGFVHVTGMEACGPEAKNSYVIGENIKPDEYGCWNRNNGKTTIITTGGEVWLRGGAFERNEAMEAVMNKFAPHGKYGFVPLSNGEVVDQHLLLCRIADPGYLITDMQERDTQEGEE